jgi:hypothetical protein
VKQINQNFLLLLGMFYDDPFLLICVITVRVHSSQQTTNNNIKKKNWTAPKTRTITKKILLVMLFLFDTSYKQIQSCSSTYQRLHVQEFSTWTRVLACSTKPLFTIARSFMAVRAHILFFM